MPARSSIALEPRITAVPFLERSRGRALSLLTQSEATQIESIGEPVNFRKGDVVYRAQAPADSIYNLVQGAAKTMKARPSADALVTRFLFPGDVFGLAEQGHYAESAEAIVASVAHKIPIDAFARLLEGNGALAVRVICRLAHDLRETQRQSHILARNDAVGRIAMFLDLLARADLVRGTGGSSYLPMSRSDIADFVGLTIEAVSRAFSMLDRLKIVTFVDRHHFHVLDRDRLEALANGAVASEVTPKRETRTPKRRSK